MAAFGNYERWKIINKILNIARGIKGIPQISPEENPYTMFGLRKDDEVFETQNSGEGEHDNNS